MKCMICGNDTKPSAPLCFCEDCRKNRKSDVEARREKHRLWFAQIIADERRNRLNESHESVNPENPQNACPVNNSETMEAGFINRESPGAKDRDSSQTNKTNKIEGKT